MDGVKDDCFQRRKTQEASCKAINRQNQNHPSNKLAREQDSKRKILYAMIGRKDEERSEGSDERFGGSFFCLIGVKRKKQK